MVMCSKGCPRPTWNGKPGCCSKACRDDLLCKRVGCTERSWNGKSGGYCSKACRDGMHSVPIPILWQLVNLIAFYFPGRESPVDKLCRASFLGNFYEEAFFMVIQGRRVLFYNAEAAYQSLKYIVDCRKFSDCQTGLEAFKHKQYLDDQGPGVRDPTFHGFGSTWNAMWYVLKAKFKHPRMVELLCQTGDAFLLEHCDRRGRDYIWSDNNDGEGTNWLGLLLMYLRNYLLGRHCRYGLENLDLEENQGPTHTNHKWMNLVRHHSSVVRRTLH